MALSTWYEVCVCRAGSGKTGDEEIDKSPHITLDSAKFGVQRFRELYPEARLIFVRQHMAGKGTNRRCRVLHALTVHNGSTADERRAAATLEPAAGT